MSINFMSTMGGGGATIDWSNPHVMGLKSSRSPDDEDALGIEVILEREVLGPAVDLVVDSQLKAVGDGCRYFSRMLLKNEVFTAWKSWAFLHYTPTLEVVLAREKREKTQWVIRRCFTGWAIGSKTGILRVEDVVDLDGEIRGDVIADRAEFAAASEKRKAALAKEKITVEQNRAEVARHKAQRVVDKTMAREEKRQDDFDRTVAETEETKLLAARLAKMGEEYGLKSTKGVEKAVDSLATKDVMESQLGVMKGQREDKDRMAGKLTLLKMGLNTSFDGDDANLGGKFGAAVASDIRSAGPTGVAGAARGGAASDAGVVGGAGAGGGAASDIGHKNQYMHMAAEMKNAFASGPGSAPPAMAVPASLESRATLDDDLADELAAADQQQPGSGQGSEPLFHKHLPSGKSSLKAEYGGSATAAVARAADHAEKQVYKARLNVGNALKKYHM